MLTASALIKNMSCWELREMRTRPLKDSPLSFPAENFNFPQEPMVAQHACVLHPALWVEAEGKLAPTLQVSVMVSVSSMRPSVNHSSLL